MGGKFHHDPKLGRIVHEGEPEYRKPLLRDARDERNLVQRTPQFTSQRFSPEEIDMVWPRSDPSSPLRDAEGMPMFESRKQIDTFIRRWNDRMPGYEIAYDQF